jgi:hypothetical protein
MGAEQAVMEYLAARQALAQATARGLTPGTGMAHPTREPL